MVGNSLCSSGAWLALNWHHSCLLGQQVWAVIFDYLKSFSREEKRREVGGYIEGQMEDLWGFDSLKYKSNDMFSSLSPSPSFPPPTSSFFPLPYYPSYTFFETKSPFKVWGCFGRINLYVTHVVTVSLTWSPLLAYTWPLLVLPGPTVSPHSITVSSMHGLFVPYKVTLLRLWICVSPYFKFFGEKAKGLETYYH